MCETLPEYARQAGLQIVAPAEGIEKLRSRPLRGKFESRAALNRLIAGSGLKVARDDGETITLVRQPQVLASLGTGLPSAPAGLSGQDAPAQEGPVGERPEGANHVKTIDGMQVLAVRGRPRTVADSPVPIDVFNMSDIEAIPYKDTTQLLSSLIPSYTVSRNSNSDGGTSVRPPSLRGLPGNKTLMLVNSKRRHRTASVPNSGYGSQSADASVIPSMALRSIEVLRDGAAAQYGSDAIAGVINFLLKDEASGGQVSLQTGQYYEGDGDDYSISGNMGFPIGSSGFLNLTAEYVDVKPTHRGTQFKNSSFDAVGYAAEHPEYAAAVDLSRPLQRTGQPEMFAIKTFFNAGYDFGNGNSFYAFGGYTKSETTTHGGYRYPYNGQAVNDVPIRLQDGTQWRFNQMFPGGFRPIYTGVVNDYSLAAGYKFDLGKVNFDVSANYGNDELGYKLKQVPNPSLGPDTPTRFTPGSTISDEFSLNVDGSVDVLEGKLDSPVTLNFGAEYREEGFKITEGDYASYAQGPWGASDPFGFCTDDHAPSAAAPAGVGLNCANYLADASDGYAGIDPVYNVLDVGSAGIPGTSPDYTGDWVRKSHSAYLEATADVTERLFLDLAGRYESYDQFGDKFNGKVAFLYKFNDVVGLRGSYGSGFRAPSIGQIYLTNVRVTFIDGEATAVGTFPATHPASSFLGARPLQPETSKNYSLGLTMRFDWGLSMSLDAYRIEVDDTIYMTPLVSVTDDIRQQLVDAGVPGALTLTSMRFFQNAFESTTSGIDFVGQYNVVWGSGSRTSFSLALNRNKYEVGTVKIPGLFTDPTIFNFEKSMPRWRGVATANHSVGPWSAIARLNLTGPYDYQRTTAPYPVQRYGSEVMLDLEGTYNFSSGWAITLGVKNVADNYPDKDAIGSVTNGAIYRDGPVDWQGGYYYARVGFVF